MTLICFNISEINIHHRAKEHASNAFATNAQVFMEITEISAKISVELFEYIFSNEMHHVWRDYIAK